MSKFPKLKRPAKTRTFKGVASIYWSAFGEDEYVVLAPDAETLKRVIMNGALNEKHDPKKGRRATLKAFENPTT